MAVLVIIVAVGVIYGLIKRNEQSAPVAVSESEKQPKRYRNLGRISEC